MVQYAWEQLLSKTMFINTSRIYWLYPYFYHLFGKLPSDLETCRSWPFCTPHLLWQQLGHLQYTRHKNLCFCKTYAPRANEQEANRGLLILAWEMSSAIGIWKCKTRHMLVKHGCSWQQQCQNTCIQQKFLSPTFWLRLIPRGMGCQSSVRNL